MQSGSRRISTTVSPTLCEPAGSPHGLIEVEAAEHFGAARYERTTARTTERNGARAKVITLQLV